MKKITTIPGDGIGKEVMEAGIHILNKLDLNIDYIPQEAGYELYQKTGNNIPEETIKSAKKTDATLFGAVTSVPGEKSAIIELRKALDVYANLRPIKSYPGVKGVYDDVDFLIVRENSEGLYAQVEEATENRAIAKRIITEKASTRICQLAFQQAIKENRESVTCVHKANVLKKTDGLFKKIFYQVAENYPEIKTNDFYVDATAMYLLTDPQRFNVIVTTNLFGDILSDEGAGLVGGLGIAPSGNIGEENGLFEPVHGSAPDIAGQNISNPISMILTISMMLEYLNEDYSANKLKKATTLVLKEGKVKTPDLGGVNKTMEVAEEINKTLEKIL
jgi:methanogen homoisocitrate dehydrogenase